MNDTFPLLQQRWIACLNNSSSTAIPPYGLVRVVSIDSTGLLTVDQPNTDGQDVYVNGPQQIAASGYGSVTRDWPTFAYYDTGDGTPANGETWGAGNASYKLRKGKSGFTAEGAGIGGYVFVAGETPIFALALTTKGDLLGFDTAANRIPIGTDAQVLTADSAQALGLKWATPSAGSSPPGLNVTLAKQQAPEWWNLGLVSITPPPIVQQSSQQVFLQGGSPPLPPVAPSVPPQFGRPPFPGYPGNPGTPALPGLPPVLPPPLPLWGLLPYPGAPGTPQPPGGPGLPPSIPPPGPSYFGGPGRPGTPSGPGYPGHPGSPGNPGQPGYPGDPGQNGQTQSLGLHVALVNPGGRPGESQQLFGTSPLPPNCGLPPFLGMPPPSVGPGSQSQTLAGGPGQLPLDMDLGFGSDWPAPLFAALNAASLNRGTTPTGRYPGGAFSGASQLLQLNGSGTVPTTNLPGGGVNGASELVQLDGSGKLPVLDGTALTGVAKVTATEATGTTASGYATVFDITNTGGLIGSFCLKNNGGSNGLTYQITATDKLGNSGSFNASLAFNNTVSFSLNVPFTSIGTVFVPFSEVKVEVKDLISGNHTTFDSWRSVVG